MGCRRQSGRGLVQLELHGSRLLFARLQQRQPVEVTRKRRLARVGGAKIKRKGLVPGKKVKKKKKKGRRGTGIHALSVIFFPRLSSPLLSSPLSLSLISSTLSLCSQNRRRGSFLLCFRLCAAHTGLQTSLSRLTPCDSCAPFTPCSPSNALSLSPSLSLEKGRKKEERREKERKSPR